MKTSDLMLIIFIYIVFSFSMLLPKNNKVLEIDFWNVGQGDSIYISTPNGKKILIDGGDNFETDFEIAKLIPFYSCKLDVIVLTHPHYDHIKGLNRVLQRCEVGVVMFNDVDFTSRDFLYFKEKTENINVKNVFAGDEFVIDNVNFKILWPSKEFLQNKVSDINDSSVVIFLDYGNFEALLAGDATSKVLENINPEGIRSEIDGEFEVIKIPHHGSKYSLAKGFYAGLKPKTCVISVGAVNKFGHPSPDTIKFLEEIGCNVLRTDIKGDIKIKVF